VEERIWHAQYPAGLARDLAYGEHDTLVTLIEGAFAKHGPQTAVTCNGESLTFAEIEYASARLAGFLQAAGLAQGDRVALLLPNHLLYPVALAAIARAGLVGVTMNPLYTAREVEFQLADSGASALLVADPFTALAAEVIDRTEVRHVIGAPMQNVKQALLASAGDRLVLRRAPDAALVALDVAIAQDASFVRPQVHPSHLAFLQYTGGTTGVSKGACLTHRNVLASVLQMQSWLRLIFDLEKLELVTPLPLYHIFPLGMALMTLVTGGHNRLVTNPRDIKALCAELNRAPFDVLIGVNTLFNGMVNTPELTTVDLTRCRMAIGAGASIQEAVARRWQEAGGPPITEAYGLSETSPSATFNAPGCNGAIGIPVPSTDVLVVDDGDKPVPLGTPGELLIKGPQVFAGYWKRESETRKVFTEDGWFRTGDVVTMDAKGLMRIVDRKKDMILVSGFNVYPNEIEAMVAMHPGVLECACIGVPDERSGEVPHLFLVRRTPELSEQQIEAHCRNLLAAYKVPRHITFVEALPKSTIGKILRKELRASASAPAAATT
jgi:long-chain acyl-CoA synthetase